MTAIVYSFFHSPLSVNIWWDDTLKKLLWFIYCGHWLYVHGCEYVEYPQSLLAT